MNILTETDFARIHRETTGASRFSETDLLAYRAIEAAVLSKLADQGGEPIYIEATCELQNWKWIRVSKTSAEEYAKWGWKIRKLYTEAQYLAAQQKAAEACAKLVIAMRFFGASSVADAIRNNWREYL